MTRNVESHQQVINALSIGNRHQAQSHAGVGGIIEACHNRLMKTLVLLVLLLASISAHSNSCEPAAIIDQACQYFKKRKHEPFIKLKEGTQYRNPLFKGEVPAEDDLTGLDSKNDKRIQELFNQIKMDMRAQLLNGVPEKSLSPAKKSLLARLDSVKLIPPEDQSKEVRMKCAMRGENAFYVFATNSLAICQGYYKYPSGSLAMSLGHEMGHSIDSCSCSHGLYSINREFVETNKADEEGNVGWDHLFGEGEQINLVRIKEYEDLFRKVGKKKSGPGFNLIAEAIPAAKHPYKSHRSCLIAEEKFEERTPPEVDPKDCHYSQMNEASSDIFGGVAFASFNKSQPFASTEEAYSLFAMADEELCDPKMKARQLYPGIPDYPNTRKRFQSVILKVPGVAEAFGCETEVSTCFKDMDRSQKAGGGAQLKNKTKSRK